MSLSAVAATLLISGLACGTPLAEPMPIAIPPGAGSEVARKKPVVILDIEAEKPTSPDAKLCLDPGSAQVARKEIEALLPRMKRFTVFNIYNDAGKKKARQLSDAGVMEEVDIEVIPKPDLFLNISAQVGAELNEDKADDSLWYVCTAKLTYSLTDSKGRTLEDTPDASGTIRTPAPSPGAPISEMKNVRQIKRYWHEPSESFRTAGGFVPSDPESAATLVRQTLSDPIKGLAAKLAKALPVTATVTGINESRKKFGIAVGQRGGIFRNTTMVVWTREGGIPFAIARVRAEPEAESSALHVLEWNTGDEDAKALIGKLQTQGLDGGLQGKLFATTEDIPLAEMLAP